LYYDRIVILHEDLFRFKLKEAIGDDLDYLENEGIVQLMSHNVEDETDQEYREGRGIFAMSFFASEGTVEARSLPRQASNGGIRARTARLAKLEKEKIIVPFYHAFEACPAYNEELPAPAAEPTLVKATEMLFKYVPIPADDVPWEQIQEFRSDKDSRKSAERLSQWARQLSVDQDVHAIERIAAIQREDLIEKIAEHQMKHNLTTVKMILPILDIVTAPIAALLNAKPSETFAPFVEIGERWIERNSSEAAMKREPLYFLSELHERFST